MPPRPETVARLRAVGVQTLAETPGFVRAAVRAEAVATAAGATEPPPWPEPDPSLVRAEAIPAPSWPTEVLPPFWQTWTSAAAEGAGAPQAFVATALLAAAGAAIGNSRWASPWASWREPPAIFAALIGRPSSGKSPALDVVQDLLTYAEAEENADWPERRRQHQSALAEAKERRTVWEAEVKTAVRERLAPPDLPAGAEEPKPEQRRRLFTTDSTVEKAARLSEPNPRGLILLRDELSGWLAGMDRYSGTAGGDRPFWLQAFGGRAWTQDRVKDPEPILIPHLLWSILGTVQPDRVASLMTAGDDDGLTARFLFCWPDPLPPRRPSCRADTAGARRAILRLRRLPWQDSPEPLVIPLAPGAITAMGEWRLQVAALEAEASGLMLSWIGKLPGLAVRLGLILEYLGWSVIPDLPEPTEVSEAALVAALTLLESFALPMARRTFGAAGLPQVERDGRRLARWLIQQRPIPETVNARRLRQMGDGPGIPDAERMEAALSELSAAGWTRPAPNRDGGPGRARKDWAVNPRLAEVAP